MATVRTQADRHWVKVEYAPSNGRRRALIVDLNMVDDVMAIYSETDKTKVTGVRVTSSAMMKPFVLQDDGEFTTPSASFFWEQWQAFINIRAEQEPGEERLIHTAKVSDFK